MNHIIYIFLMLLYANIQTQRSMIMMLAPCLQNELCSRFTFLKCETQAPRLMHSSHSRFIHNSPQTTGAHIHACICTPKTALPLLFPHYRDWVSSFTLISYPQFSIYYAVYALHAIATATAAVIVTLEWDGKNLCNSYANLKVFFFIPCSLTYFVLHFLSLH